MEKDYPPRSGILPQYANLTSMHKAMPVIRKLLGLPEHGRLPQTPIGRVLQRAIERNSENIRSKSEFDQHKTTKQK